MPFPPGTCLIGPCRFCTMQLQAVHMEMYCLHWRLASSLSPFVYPLSLRVLLPLHTASDNFFHPLQNLNFILMLRKSLCLGNVSVNCLWIRSQANFDFSIMGQLSLARFRGDTTFALTARVLSTFAGGVLGIVIWYPRLSFNLIYQILIADTQVHLAR